MAGTANSNPYIEGDSVTFVWQGDAAPALISDLHEWEYNPQTLQQAEPGQWVYQTRIPQDAYIEYAFLDLETFKRLPDPLNAHTCTNGLGDTNHYFYMPGAAPSALTRRQRGVPKGQLTRHQLPTGEFLASRQRSVALYQPPTRELCPLLVVFDGQDYISQGKLVQIVDNLIAQGRIQPIAMALIYHGGSARLSEYVCSDATLGFLDSIVLPLAQKELNLIDVREAPGSYAVMGASMGGLMALYAGLRLPEYFGRVLSQSGAFRLFGYRMVLLDLVRYFPTQPLNIWMNVGRFEQLLPVNREMQALLIDKGYQVCYHEFAGGHNYTSWRDNLWRGLEYLFGSR
jgi:enterochelin esterase family protein